MLHKASLANPTINNLCITGDIFILRDVVTGKILKFQEFLLCDFIASVDFNFNAPPEPSYSYFSLLLPDLDH